MYKYTVGNMAGLALYISACYDHYSDDNEHEEEDDDTSEEEEDKED